MNECYDAILQLILAEWVKKYKENPRQTWHDLMKKDEEDISVRQEIIKKWGSEEGISIRRETIEKFGSKEGAVSCPNRT